MTKNLAKRNFICMAILACLLLVLCFINIAVPTSNYRFVGFANAIQKDIDIAGGYSADYTVNFRDGELDKEGAFNQTIQMIENKLVSYGYGSATVTASGMGSVHIEIPDVKQAENVLEAIGVDGDLYIRTSETTEIADTDLTADDINDIVALYGQTDPGVYNWGINIEFSTEGTSKIKSLTEDGSGTLYIYVGEEVFSKVSFSSQITNNSIFIFGSTSDQDSTNIYALNLLIAKQTVGLNMIDNEIVKIDATYGENVQTMLLIASIVILVAFMAVMFIAFGEFGYIALLSFAFFASFMMFLLQAIPVFTLSLAGIVGLVLATAIYFISTFVIFNKIKSGYAEGKKLPLAVKLGFKNSVLTVVDINVIVVISAILLYFLGGGAYAQSFAMVLGVGSALTLLLTLLLDRWFAKWYLRINSTKARKLHFVRGANVNELE